MKMSGVRAALSSIACEHLLEIELPSTCVACAVKKNVLMIVFKSELGLGR